MIRSKVALKSWALTAIVAYLFVFAPFSPAMAAWVSTPDTLNTSKTRLLTLVEREDVKASIASLGLDPAEAVRRVDAMSEAEASQALAKIDTMGAGGDSIGVVVGAAVLVFVILLITDIAGLTNVFPFTKK